MISGRSSLLAKALLSVYLLTTALPSLTHHDVICHAKSTTHCTACLATASGEAAPRVAGADGARLIDAGRVNAGETAYMHAAPERSSAGRSPPDPR
jgi:hypothetical protein